MPTLKLAQMREGIAGPHVVLTIRDSQHMGEYCILRMRVCHILIVQLSLQTDIGSTVKHWSL